MTKPKLAGTRPIGDLLPATSDDALFLATGKNCCIQWPTEGEVQEVSARLARIVQVGLCSEANGDHSMSGDLAYQIQEIIRATVELCRKSERARK